MGLESNAGSTKITLIMIKEANISEEGKRSLVSSLRKHILIRIDPEITNRKINNEANSEVFTLFLTCMKFGLHRRVEKAILGETNSKIQFFLLEYYCLFNVKWVINVFNKELQKRNPVFLEVVNNGKDVDSDENMQVILDIFNKVNTRNKVNADLHVLVDSRYQHLLKEL
jgi:hypothetical protein